MIVRNFYRWFPVYRIKAAFFSLIFGLIVISLYYILQWGIPGDIAHHGQIVTFLFIILSVLILFPAREIFFRLILKETEIRSILGLDSHHIDVVGKHFTMQSLIEEIFPELLQWLNVLSAKLAILESDRKHFAFYLYSHGELVKREAHYYHGIEDVEKMLTASRKPVYADSPDLDEVAREVMLRFRAIVIHPIFYRKSLIGFFILHESPRHQYSRRALDLLADKASVSIHDHILSNRLFDMRKYELEFRQANRIRQFLQNTHIPELPGYRLKSLKTEKSLCLLEFFSAPPKRWFLVIVYSSRLSSAAGLILSGLLGHLYSYFHFDKQLSLHKLISYLRKDEVLNRSEYRMNLLVAEIVPAEGTMTVIPDTDFFIQDVNNEMQLQMHANWRNLYELSYGVPLRICYGSGSVTVPLLEILREGDELNFDSPDHMQVERP